MDKIFLQIFYNNNEKFLYNLTYYEKIGVDISNVNRNLTNCANICVADVVAKQEAKQLILFMFLNL